MAQNQIPMQDVSVAAANRNQVMSITSMYVGDLDENVTDVQLYNLFSVVGHVISVRVCRDFRTRRSLGYGYVNFGNPQDAARAMEKLNFTPVGGRCIRIMYSHRDSMARKSCTANVFIKNLDKEIDNMALHDIFSHFGNILSCKIATDNSGQSKGYGFVQFDSEDSAKKAINRLNNMLFSDKKVYVGHFMRRQEREASRDERKFNNVFVKNLSDSTTDEDLQRVFGEYGLITSAVVMRDRDGKSKCFGFVNFGNVDDAARAVEALNGRNFAGKNWYVGKAQKKSERELELKSQFGQRTEERVDKFKGLNLYIKNLDDSIDDEKLKELFSEFGTITSSKVVRNARGISRGSGFVAFSTAEEASRALAELNGKVVVSKPLFVALAQRKEERAARLQAHFSQMRTVQMSPTFGPRMPVYQPGAPGLGQPLVHGQTPPAMVPPQVGSGYQQQPVPAFWPAGVPMRNFLVPMGQHGQQGLRSMHQTQQPLAMMQQQVNPQRRMPVTALATALTNATPQRQRVMLGERLYPLVNQIEHEHSAQITGMLLEMGPIGVLHMLEFPEALRQKVIEAMALLRSVATQNHNSSADQMASLSIN